MTKEDVLWSFPQGESEPYGRVPINRIYEAMDKWAKSFANWTNKRGWTEYDTYDRWICPSQSNEVIDTETLYKRFEEDKNK